MARRKHQHKLLTCRCSLYTHPGDPPAPVRWISEKAKRDHLRQTVDRYKPHRNGWKLAIVLGCAVTLGVVLALCMWLR